MCIPWKTEIIRVWFYYLVEQVLLLRKPWQPNGRMCHMHDSNSTCVTSTPTSNKAPTIRHWSINAHLCFLSSSAIIAKNLRSTKSDKNCRICSQYNRDHLWLLWGLFQYDILHHKTGYVPHSYKLLSQNSKQVSYYYLVIYTMIKLFRTVITLTLRSKRG